MSKKRSNWGVPVGKRTTNPTEVKLLNHTGKCAIVECKQIATWEMLGHKVCKIHYDQGKVAQADSVDTFEKEVEDGTIAKGIVAIMNEKGDEIMKDMRNPHR